MIREISEDTQRKVHEIQEDGGHQTVPVEGPRAGHGIQDKPGGKSKDQCKTFFRYYHRDGVAKFSSLVPDLPILLY